MRRAGRGEAPPSSAEGGWIHGHEVIGRVAGVKATGSAARSRRATVPDSLSDELMTAP
jgi:hypothetical protein